jgi:uncharacterized protein
VIALTAAGRGQVVTHALYLPEELEKVRSHAGQLLATATGQPAEASVASQPTTTPAQSATTLRAGINASGASPAPASSKPDDYRQLRAELDEVKAELARLKMEVQNLWANLR